MYTTLYFGSKMDCSEGYEAGVVESLVSTSGSDADADDSSDSCGGGILLTSLNRDASAEVVWPR